MQPCISQNQNKSEHSIMKRMKFEYFKEEGVSDSSLLKGPMTSFMDGPLVTVILDDNFDVFYLKNSNEQELPTAIFFGIFEGTILILLTTRTCERTPHHLINRLSFVFVKSAFPPF